MATYRCEKFGHIKSILSVALVLSFVFIAGNYSYTDEIGNSNYYCKMVIDGYWPDYENRNCIGDKS
jgi:hypothetical protein